MNRKTISKLTFVGVIATMIGFSACGNKENSTTATASKDSTSASAKITEPIVFVNSDSLLNNYTYFKELRSKFENKTKNAEADLKNRAQAFQREVAQYQQSQQNLSAEQRQTTEERLARKQQELQTYQQNAGGALQNEQAQEQEKLYDKVADYLKVFAKKNGHKMVLTYSKGNSSILFADESLDVTHEVMKGLNEEYKAKK